MLSTRGLAALINSEVAVFLCATLFYNPQLFLLAFFLHAFFASYILLYMGKLGRINEGMIRAWRDVSHTVVQSGGTFTVSVKVSSELEESFVAEFRDEVPSGLILVEGTSMKSGLLRRGVEAEILYRVKPSQAVHRIFYRYIFCIIYDPLGLVARKLRIAAPQEILVVRDEWGPLQESIALREHYTSPAPGVGINPFLGIEDEYLGVRPYEHGDRLRDIHWKKTAAATSDDSIFVKRYERRSEAQLNIVVDCSSSINAGLNEAYIMDVSRLVGAITSSALDEGNIIHLYVLNPELSIDEVLSSKISSSIGLLKRLSLLYPTEGQVPVEVVNEIETRMSRGSRLIVISNPPSENQEVVRKLIERAVESKCVITIIIPDIDSYYPSISEHVDTLLRVDKLIKTLWLRGMERDITLIHLSARSSSVMLEWGLRKR